jgi:hypothetical protein
VHPVLPDGSPEGVGLAELPAEAQLNLNTSVAAHKNALAAAKVALERAAAHWANEGGSHMLVLEMLILEPAVRHFMLDDMGYLYHCRVCAHVLYFIYLHVTSGPAARPM